ncbi:HAD-IC family P-type ATPase, partial [candidate division WOR-3 bacterium]|nr:HAD-IC family P-type ATPase [candidate division WOR-3 bacterium]
MKTKPSGLSNKEVALRLQRFGTNILPEAKKLSVITLFLHQFRNPLIYILFVALIISFATKHFLDAWIIVVVILISSIVGFMQEYKADQALSKLKQMVKHKTKVLRDGKKIVIAQEQVVPGDIIFLSPGDKIPADARLIKAQNFEVIEATLTGESAPSKKSVDILPQDIPLADRENMI